MTKLVRREQNAPSTAHQENRGPRFVQPYCSVFETDDKVLVELEMPGVERDKIEVTVDHDELTVTGWRKAEDLSAYEVLLKERRPQAYKRSFVLGESIDSSNITATYENGVLKLVLPKAEVAKPRRIEIK